MSCSLNVTYTADALGDHTCTNHHVLRMPRKWNLGQMLGLAEAFGEHHENHDARETNVSALFSCSYWHCHIHVTMHIQYIYIYTYRR